MNGTGDLFNDLLKVAAANTEPVKGPLAVGNIGAKIRAFIPDNQKAFFDQGLTK
jgi:hypothetical protein